VETKRFDGKRDLGAANLRPALEQGCGKQTPGARNFFLTEWHDRTNRAVFTWQEPRRKEGMLSYEDRKSTWNSGVQKAIRRGSAEEDVHKHRDCATGDWKQISKQ